VALSGTARLVLRSVRDPASRSALAGLLRRLPAALRARRPVPAALEQRFATAQRPLSDPAAG
jgi:hypothetical protein